MARNAKKLSLYLLIVAGMLVPASAQAASKTAVHGISLSPFEQQVSIAPDDTDTSYMLGLTNHTAGLQELDLSVHDFGSLNDTGGILLEGNGHYSQKYGLAAWLSLGTDTVVLQPGESRQVQVTINNRSSLAPGGHYGAVVASVNSLNGQSGNHVVINQQLLSLVLVDKVGGDHYDLRLQGIKQNGNWLHLPNTVTVRFQNPGNVHVIPRGTVKLKSPGGTVVAQGIINSESAFVLPESFRELYVPLTKIGSAAPWPGLYNIEVDYRYEQITRTATKTYTLHFVDLGLYFLFAALLVIASVFLRKRLHL